MVTTVKAEGNKKKQPFHDFKDKVKSILVDVKKKINLWASKHTYCRIIIEYDVWITIKTDWTETNLGLAWIKMIHKKQKILHSAYDPSDGDLNILLTACIQKVSWNRNKGSSSFRTSGWCHCLGNGVLVGDVA